MLASVCDVFGIAPQRRQHLLMAVGKPHALHDQVLAVLPNQAIGHSQTQGHRAVIGNGSHAELATRRLIPTTEHEELVAAGISPVPEPLLMAGVAIGIQVNVAFAKAASTRSTAALAPTRCRLPV